MEITCPYCNHSFTGTLLNDAGAFNAICPMCRGTFKYPIRRKQYEMIFAWDDDDSFFTDEFEDGTCFISYYSFDTLGELIEEWERISENPDSMWYWVLDNGEVVCSGACDPDDYEIFEEVFDIPIKRKKFTVSISETRYGKTTVYAETGKQAEDRVLRCCLQNEIVWHSSEITDAIAEEVLN